MPLSLSLVLALRFVHAFDRVEDTAESIDQVTDVCVVARNDAADIADDVARLDAAWIDNDSACRIE